MKRYAIFALLTIFTGCSHPGRPDFAPAEPNLKIVTYNVNWGFAQPRVIVDFLDGADADIICLQETHKYWEMALKKRLSQRYSYGFFKDSGGAGGIAIMSKYPLRDIKVIEPNLGWFPALFARVHTPIGEIQFLNIHLRPPLSDEGSVTVSGYLDAPDVHLMEIKGFFAGIDPNKPLIITGDFNENEDDKAVRWLIDNGFTDTLSIFDTYGKTWIWKTSAGISLKARYDHVIINKYLACTGAAVSPVRASDHLPVIATIIKK